MTVKQLTFLLAMQLIAITTLLWFNGNILIFTTPPVQVCIGWPDDNVYSWACTPDYTVETGVH
jgi:hypothetical protein